MENSTTRDVLAKNLKALIQVGASPERPNSVRAWALGRGLDVKTIDRLTKGQHAVTLDTLEEIAKACGLKPWHLLLEDFDPHSPPDAPITEDERKLLARLRNLLGP